MKPPYAYGDTTGSTRRTMLRRAAATAMLGPLFKVTPGIVSAQQTVNRNSAPSKLRITDMRACRVAANYDYPIVKIYTNQDVYGLGEVRDAGVEGIALILKAHLLGKDPLDIVGNLRPLRQFMPADCRGRRNSTKATPVKRHKREATLLTNGLCRRDKRRAGAACPAFSPLNGNTQAAAASSRHAQEPVLWVFFAVLMGPVNQ